MTWGSVLLACITGMSALLSFLREKQLISLAEAQGAADRLGKELDALRESIAIRERVAADLAADPSRLRENDGFKRKPPDAAPANQGRKPPVL